MQEISTMTFYNLFIEAKSLTHTHVLEVCSVDPYAAFSLLRRAIGDGLLAVYRPVGYEEDEYFDFVSHHLAVKATNVGKTYTQVAGPGVPVEIALARTDCSHESIPVETSLSFSEIPEKEYQNLLKVRDFSKDEESCMSES